MDAQKQLRALLSARDALGAYGPSEGSYNAYRGRLKALADIELALCDLVTPPAGAVRVDDEMDVPVPCPGCGLQFIPPRYKLPADGCGACGDACEGRPGGCEVAESSPPIAKPPRPGVVYVVTAYDVISTTADLLEAAGDRADWK